MGQLLASFIQCLHPDLTPSVFCLSKEPTMPNACYLGVKHYGGVFACLIIS